MLDNPDTRVWISTVVGALVASGAGVYDTFFGHFLGRDVDIVLIMIGLGALGLRTTGTITAAKAARIQREANIKVQEVK